MQNNSVLAPVDGLCFKHFASAMAQACLYIYARSALAFNTPSQVALAYFLDMFLHFHPGLGTLSNLFCHSARQGKFA